MSVMPRFSGLRRPGHHAVPIVALAAALALAAVPAAASGECSGNDLCLCAEELTRSVQGLPVDTSRIAGGLSDSPATMFGRGGSQNIPVICHAVDYRLNGDPSWFLEYFRLQADRQPPGFLGTEIFSPLYMQSIVASILTVRDRAAEIGDTELTAAADGWLRPFWAVAALATVDGRIQSGSLVQQSTVVPVAENQLYRGGLTLAAAGMRADKEGAIGMYTLLHPMVALALDWQPRGYSAGLHHSPAFYGSLYAVALALDYPIGEGGRGDFEGHSPPPESFGLSPADQALLASFVSSGGTQGLADVVAMIGDLRPSCDISFRRTADGMSSWFGTSSSEQGFCNRNKGPIAAMTFDRDQGHATWLHPSVRTFPAEPGVSYRKGDELCARPEGLTERCIDLLPGELVYEVSWTRARGVEVVEDPLRQMPAATPDAPADAAPPPAEDPEPAPPPIADDEAPAETEEPALPISAILVTHPGESEAAEDVTAAGDESTDPESEPAETAVPESSGQEPGEAATEEAGDPQAPDAGDEEVLTAAGDEPEAGAPEAPVPGIETPEGEPEAETASPPAGEAAPETVTPAEGAAADTPESGEPGGGEPAEPVESEDPAAGSGAPAPPAQAETASTLPRLHLDGSASQVAATATTHCNFQLELQLEERDDTPTGVRYRGTAHGRQVRSLAPQGGTAITVTDELPTLPAALEVDRAGSLRLALTLPPAGTGEPLPEDLTRLDGRRTASGDAAGNWTCTATDLAGLPAVAAAATARGTWTLTAAR